MSDSETTGKLLDLMAALKQSVAPVSDSQPAPSVRGLCDVCGEAWSAHDYRTSDHNFAPPAPSAPAPERVTLRLVVNGKMSEQTVDLSETVEGFLVRLRWAAGYRDYTTEWEIRTADGADVALTEPDGSPRSLSDALLTLYLQPRPGTSA